MKIKNIFRSLTFLISLIFTSLILAQQGQFSSINYMNETVVKEQSGPGVPLLSCTGLTRYTQTTTVGTIPAGSMYQCINGQMVNVTALNTTVGALTLNATADSTFTLGTHKSLWTSANTGPCSPPLCSTENSFTITDASTEGLVSLYMGPGNVLQVATLPGSHKNPFAVYTQTTPPTGGSSSPYAAFEVTSGENTSYSAKPLLHSYAMFNKTSPYGNSGGGGFEMDTTFAFPSEDIGNPGTSAGGWSGGAQLAKNFHVYSRGISQMNAENYDKSAVGDVAMRYSYGTFFGGVIAPSDEGITVDAQHSFQMGYIQGTAYSNGAYSGGTTPTLATGSTLVFSNNTGCHNGAGCLSLVYNDGGYLLDITAGGTPPTTVPILSLDAAGAQMNDRLYYDVSGTPGSGFLSSAWGNIVPTSCTNGIYVTSYSISGGVVTLHTSSPVDWMHTMYQYANLWMQGFPTSGPTAGFNTGGFNPYYSASGTTITITNTHSSAPNTTLTTLSSPGLILLSSNGQQQAYNVESCNVTKGTGSGNFVAPTPLTVSSYSIDTNNIATFTTTSAHSFVVGESVALFAFPSSGFLDGLVAQVQSVPTSTTFTAALYFPHSSQTLTTETGSVVPASTDNIALAASSYENAAVLSVGTPTTGYAGDQNITFATRYAWDNANGNTLSAIVMQGGVSGDDFVVAGSVGNPDTSWPLSWQVLGAIPASDAASPTGGSTARLFFANCIGGGCLGGSSSAYPIPFFGSQFGATPISSSRTGGLFTFMTTYLSSFLTSLPVGQELVGSGFTPTELNTSYAVLANTKDWNEYNLAFVPTGPPITGFTVTGSSIVFTANNGFSAGQPVLLSGFSKQQYLPNGTNPTNFNGMTVPVTAATGTSFTVACSSLTGGCPSNISSDSGHATLVGPKITSYSITNGVGTFQVANSFSAGQQVTLAGFANSLNLDGQVVTVLTTGLSSSKFEANVTGYATMTATEVGGAVTGLTVSSGGTGYASSGKLVAPTITMSAPSSGVTAQGYAQALLTNGLSAPYPATGSVTGGVVTTAGSGYSSAPTVYVTNSATETGTALISTLPVTAYSFDGTSTFTIAAQTSYTVGQTVTLSGFATSTFLNSITGVITSASSTSIVINAYMDGAPISLKTEAGWVGLANLTATVQGGLFNPPTYISVYPAAEVIGTDGGLMPGGGVVPVQLGVNHIPFVNGDVLIGAPSPSYHQLSSVSYVGQTSPNIPGDGSGGNIVVDSGPSPMTTGLFQAIYSGPGVNPTAYTTGGLFQAMLNMSDHPQQGGCILCVGNQSGTKGTYYLWEDGNTGSISINPFTGILTIGNTVQAPELVLADGGTGTTILNQHQWCGSTQLDSSYFGINSAIGVQTGFDGCAKLNVMIPSSGLSSTGDMNTILRGGNQYNNVGVNLGYTGGASVNTGSANLAILESYISGGDSPDTALISKSTYNLGYVALLAGGVSAATSVMSVRLPSGFLQFSADGMTLNQSAAVTYGSAITGTDSGVFKFGTGAFGNTGAELDFNAMKVGGLTGYVLCPGGTSSVCTASSTIPNTAITGLGTFATQNYASPPAIGSGTPNTGAFTSVAVGASTPANITSTSGNLTLTPSGTGVVSIGSAISWGGGTNITSSSNVPLLGSANAFTQNSTFAGRVSVGSNVATPSADLASLWNDGATATYLDSFGHTTSTYDPIELRVAHSDGSGFVYPLTINYNGITASVPIAAATGSTVNGSTICTTANGACSSGTVSDGAGVTTAGEVAVSTTTAHVLNYVTTLPNGTTATTQAANDNSTELATTAFVQGAVSVTKFFSNVTWSIQPALFSTATMLGPVYFTSYSDTRSWPQLTVRQEGPISCTVAPTVQLMDLGTNASTVYASATAIATLALGTADGVFIGNGSSTLTSDHYYGIAFSAGTCATAPTIDVTVYDTW